MPKGGKDIDWLTDLLVVCLVAVAVFPAIFAGLNTMESDTTNFSTAEIAIFSVVGILLIVALLRRIMKKHS